MIDNTNYKLKVIINKMVKLQFIDLCFFQMTEALVVSLFLSPQKIIREYKYTKIILKPPKNVENQRIFSIVICK